MQRISKLILKSFSRAARPYLNTYGLLKTAKVFNRSAMVWEPGAEKVLVLAPHMDDEVIGCGGTLAKHVARGATVSVAFLTDGGAGGAASHGDSAMRILTNRRKEEAHLALETLGIRHLIFLDAEDGALKSTSGLLGELRALMMELRFDLVYLPFFLEEHPDHRATSQILLDATRGTDINVQCLGYEVWTPLFPNCLVNIDETEALKRAALSHYRSQLADADYVHTQFGLNAYRSAAFLGGSCRFAEAFCALPLDQYRAMHTAYASQ